MTLIFVSSFNANLDLANTISKNLDQLSISNKIINLLDLNLPMYDTHKEQNDGIPKNAKDLFDEMKSANSYIFVTPEYNFNVPPVLINMIAWVSRVTKDYRELFNQKAVLLATHSGSNGFDMLNSLRNQLTKLNANVLEKEIRTTYTLALDEQSLAVALEDLKEAV